MKKTHANILITLLLLSGFLLSAIGCATTVPGPRANRSVEQAMSFHPPAGQCGIYVIRESGIVGAAASWAILLDIDDLGSISQNHYLYATAPAGDHNLTMKINMDEGKSFHADADKNYFFIVSPGMSGGHFNEVSEDRGRQLVMQMGHNQ